MVGGHSMRFLADTVRTHGDALAALCELADASTCTRPRRRQEARGRACELDGVPGARSEYARPRRRGARVARKEARAQACELEGASGARSELELAALRGELAALRGELAGLKGELVALRGELHTPCALGWSGSRLGHAAIGKKAPPAPAQPAPQAAPPHVPLGMERFLLQHARLTTPPGPSHPE